MITASILSKKLAAGLAGLAMDVKTGSGAFMPTLARSRALADSLVTVARGAGLPTNALITDMDQPLADAAGNAVEMGYAIDYLTGRRRQPRMHEITVALGAEMLLLGRVAASLDEGRARMEQAIASGAAAERFAMMVSALGGPADLLERPEAYLAPAPIVRPISPMQAGVVTGVDCRAVGLAVVELGGGRTRSEDRIDHAVGLTALAELGQNVGPDAPLALLHARDEASAARAEARIRQAYAVGGPAAAASPVILERIAP